MADTRPTYQIASPSIRPYVRPLWPGSLALPFETRDEEGRSLKLADDHLSGRHLLLVFLSDPDSEQTIPLLRSLANLADQFDAANATVIAISASSDAAGNKKLKRAAGFPWPVACDPSGALFALSISLNEEYEGGEIAFNEFSPKGYRVPAGTAMVFSSSLLHEVQETTSGVRYNLISHFFK